MPHGESHAYDALRTDRNPFLHDTPAADKAAAADLGIPVENGTGRDVTMICDRHIVFNYCTGVDNAIVSYFGTCIDSGSVHHNGPCADHSVTGDVRGGSNNRRQVKPKINGALVQTDAEGR